MMTKQAAFGMLGIVCGLAAGTAATAAPFSADYVFGDSLSDRGNLAEYLGRNFPDPPFSHDSFTNGPTAVQVMAQRMGLTEDPSLFVTGFTDKYNLGLTPGTNYAVAGATAGTLAGVPGGNLPSQVGAYLSRSGTASTDALYTVFIGGNDVRTAAHQGSASFVTDGVKAELAAVTALIAAGAQNLLVVNVPDVGAIPEFRLAYPSQAAAATSYSMQYNQALASGVSDIAGANPGLNIGLFDFFTFNNNLIPTLASLGITNTTDPCYTNTNVAAPSTATSLACGPINPATGQATNIGSLQYWDSIHPTARLQEIYGNALYDYEVTRVPEPASLALLGLGLAGLGAMRRRRATDAL